MIDIENDIYNAIVNGVSEQISGINYSSISTTAPSTFPFVLIEEMDNVPSSGYQTQTMTDDYADVTYQIDIYSNKKSGRKQEARNIAKVVDDVMTGLNFTRLSLIPVDNYLDANIYRITGRYRATVSPTKMIYRRG